jgi:hypothetical protein
MRFALAGLVALAVILAGCGAPDETSGGSTVSSLWIQTDIAGADLDGDGRTDIVTIATLQQSFGVNDGTLKVYRQTSPGVFTSTTIAVGRYPWRVQVRDVNGDNLPDLLVLDVIGGAGSNDDVLYLLLQDPNNRGRFLAPRAVASGLSASDFTVTDANIDLAPDLVTAGINGSGEGAALYLQSLASRGSFLDPSIVGFPGRLQRIAAANLGGSGREDLIAYSIRDTSATANAPGELLVAYSTLIDATNSSYYSTPRLMASNVGVNAQHIGVADVDGNALPDIIVCFTPFSTSFQAKISVVLQRALGQLEVVDTSLANVSGIDGFVVANLLGDARPEVVATGFYPVGSPSTTRSRVNIFVPALAGRYTQLSAIDMPVPMSRVNVVDVDGDTLPDIILLGEGNRAFVMFQSAAQPGTFGSPRQL